MSKVLRKCKDCGIEAHDADGLTVFKKNKRTPHGRENLCYACEYARAKARMTPEQWAAEQQRKRQWKLDNPDADMKWRRNNRDKWLPLHSAQQAKRRATKKQAVPKWFDAEEVKYIYKLAQERGLEVDHIVPLKNDLVCGLHVQDNLRCIPKELNMWKSNKLLNGVKNVSGS